jgi:methylaspartate ammonia-lyase
MDEIAVERTGGSIPLFVRKAKGDKRRTAADKLLLQLPIGGVPLLADLLEAFTA